MQLLDPATDPPAQANAVGLSTDENMLEDLSLAPETCMTSTNEESNPKTAKGQDRKSTRLNSSHSGESRMPSSA